MDLLNLLPGAIFLVSLAIFVVLRRRLDPQRRRLWLVFASGFIVHGLLVAAIDAMSARGGT